MQFPLILVGPTPEGGLVIPMLEADLGGHEGVALLATAGPAVTFEHSLDGQTWRPAPLPWIMGWRGFLRLTRTEGGNVATHLGARLLEGPLPPLGRQAAYPEPGASLAEVAEIVALPGGEQTYWLLTPVPAGATSLTLYADVVGGQVDVDAYTLGGSPEAPWLRVASASGGASQVVEVPNPAGAYLLTRLIVYADASGAAPTGGQLLVMAAVPE